MTQTNPQNNSKIETKKKAKINQNVNFQSSKSLKKFIFILFEDSHLPHIAKVIRISFHGHSRQTYEVGSKKNNVSLPFHDSTHSTIIFPIFFLSI
jgi:hypothetical protein